MIKTFFVVIAILACTGLSGFKKPPVKKNTRPNIIVILSDDMGYSDIGCYGSEIHTPNLDALAKNGLRYTQFYNTSRCCPSRASLLTGLYPHQTGIGWMTAADHQLPGYSGQLNTQCVTIAEVLKQAGYATYMTGKWHLALDPKKGAGEKYNWPLQRGFDQYYGTILGAANYFDPGMLCRNNQLITPYTDSATNRKRIISRMLFQIIVYSTSKKDTGTNLFLCTWLTRQRTGPCRRRRQILNSTRVNTIVAGNRSGSSGSGK